MKTLLGFFPLSAGATSPKGLLIAIIAYIILDIIAGVLFKILGAIPIINIVIGIVGSLFGIYTLIGIILAVLVFLKKLI